MNLQVALVNDPILAIELLGMLVLATYILRTALKSSVLSSELIPFSSQEKAENLVPRQSKVQLALISNKRNSYNSQTRISSLGYRDLKSFSQHQRKNYEARPALLGNGVGRVILLSERSLRPKKAA